MCRAEEKMRNATIRSLPLSMICTSVVRVIIAWRAAGMCAVVQPGRSDQFASQHPDLRLELGEQGGALGIGQEGGTDSV